MDGRVGYICMRNIMKKSGLVFLLLLLLLPGYIAEAKTDSSILISPDTKLVATISVQQGKVKLKLLSETDTISDILFLGVQTEKNISEADWQLTGQSRRSVNRIVSVLYGPVSNFKESFNELIMSLHDQRNHTFMMLAVRVYNQGVAFRYIVPSVKKEMKVYAELTEIGFSEDDSCIWSWADYQTLEKNYYQTSVSEAKHVSLPFTVQKASDKYIAVAEAAVVDYSTSTLRQDAAQTSLFHWDLVPAADGSAVHVHDNSDTLKTPWRVLLVGNDAAELANNQLVWLLNNPPAVDQDWSWVHPINYCGIWWEMHLGLSTWQYDGGRHGATTANAKRYIDFAAANGIQGVLIEGWNTGWEKWGTKNAFNFITPYPDFDLVEVARYARVKGVELIGHHETGGDWRHYEEMLDSAFTLYASLGIHYVKTGYAGPMQPEGESHHGQLKVEHLQRVVEKAAKYKIMIDAHEPVMPTGLSRTWPNLMTFEAVRGMEWNAWSEGNTPAHHCLLPFTRALAGPMDYTPGIVNLQLAYRQNERVKWNGLDKGTSKVHGTLAHQLALSVVFYSPMQMMADLPENYQRSNITTLLSSIPVSWDTSIVLVAEPGKYIVTARRKGMEWFVAGITDKEQRNFSVGLNKLKGIGNAKAVLYEDPYDNSLNPESLKSREVLLESGKPLLLDLKNGGGFLIVIEIQR